MNQIRKYIFKLSKYHSIILACVDCVSIIVCYALTWVLLMGIQSISIHWGVLVKSCMIFTAVFLVVYYCAGMYQSLWRYAETNEYIRCMISLIVAVVLFIVFAYYIRWTEVIPFSVYIVASFLSAISTLFYRMLYRLYREKCHKEVTQEKIKRVMIVGAGTTGASLITEFNRKKNNCYNVVCALDDDRAKKDKTILGVKIIGKISQAKSVAKNYAIDTIILAMPEATKKQKQTALSYCSGINCELLTVPDIAEMVMTGNDSETEISSTIRDVKVEELLGRDVIKVSGHSYGYLRGKRVMVTGGGGSIGSELCRQIAQVNPESLIIVDIYENNAYEIQQELIREYGKLLNLHVEIASVRDSKKIDTLFDRYRPEIVFHAAAHKHVPLMEYVPEEAVKNNIYGTWNVAKASSKYKVKRFVMISTDKAVNPTNVMGATKRACEMIVQSMNKVSDTEFVAVRFGNVLGSNGSVIPLFKQQIANGGPVTVTHPDIIRYFMTISEAVSLVLTAGEMASGGEIFVLDMGEPVKILDLAENLIRLSGLEPYKDIEINFSGLRPGEKLYEELLMGEEGLRKTPNDKIFIGEPIDIEPEEVFDFIKSAKEIAFTNNSEKTLEMLHKLVPTYKTVKQRKELNAIAEKAEK